MTWMQRTAVKELASTETGRRLVLAAMHEGIRSEYYEENDMSNLINLAVEMIETSGLNTTTRRAEIVGLMTRAAELSKKIETETAFDMNMNVLRVGDPVLVPDRDTLYIVKIDSIEDGTLYFRHCVGRCTSKESYKCILAISDFAKQI
jgi:hypothetical protein